MVISLILIYFIGRAFYELAHDYEKSLWGFAILGIVSYYAGTFIGVILLGLLGLMLNSDFTNELPKVVISLIAVPFGVGTCWGFYKFLEYQWSKDPKIIEKQEMLDGNLMD